MKKILVIAFVVVLALACTVSAFAAGSLNANEKKVISALERTVKIGDASFKLPASYVNQAKNYFLGSDVDLTADEADAIIGYIDDAIAALKAEKPKTTAAELDLADLSASCKAKLLEAGQNACEEIGLELEYDAVANEVTIKDDAGKTVFNDEPIIKKTGADVSVPAIAIAVVLLTVLSAGAIVVTKKSQLF